MNTQKPLKNKVSITLDEDVIRQIHKLAESDDRNFSQYINLILKKHIQERGNTFCSMKSTLSNILGLNVPVIPTDTFFSLLV